MMEIKFLGTGSAFTTKNWNANTLITKNGKNLLIDIGGDMKHELADAGMVYRDIDAIYISHLHGDHSDGGELFGFCTYFDPAFKDKKIQLYGNGDLLRKLWDNCWKGKMESVQGAVCELSSYFDVNMVRPNGKFIWEDVEFTLVQTIHIVNGFVFVPSFGLLVKDNESGKTVFFTTDTQNSPSQLKDFYKMADLIIQDCEVNAFKSGVHAHFDELNATVSPEIKSRMILDHYHDDILEPDELLRKIMTILPEGAPVPYTKLYKVSDVWKQKAATAGFKGFAEKGQVIVVA